MDITKRKFVGMVLVSPLSSLAGCSGKEVWYLSITDLEIAENDGTYLVSGRMGLSGQPSGVDVHNARLVFTTADDTVLSRTHVGNLSSQDTQWIIPFEENLDRRPRCVFIRYDTIDASSDTAGRVGSYFIKDDGFDGIQRPVGKEFESCQALIDHMEETRTENP